MADISRNYGSTNDKNWQILFFVLIPKWQGGILGYKTCGSFILAKLDGHIFWKDVVDLDHSPFCIVLPIFVLPPKIAKAATGSQCGHGSLYLRSPSPLTSRPRLMGWCWGCRLHGGGQGTPVYDGNFAVNAFHKLVDKMHGI